MSGTEVTMATSTVSSDDTERNNWMMMGVGSGLCMLLLILSLIVYSIHERQQNTRRKSSSRINYERLPQSPADTIPYPSQWNEEFYAEFSGMSEGIDTPNNIQDMYAKPQPKNLRNKPKTKETDNLVNEPTYCNEVDIHDAKACGDPKYAQVVPKNLRSTMKQEDIEMDNYANLASSQNYAEVVPKSQRKNNNLDDKNIPSNGYPKIVPKSSSDDQTNCSNYSNVHKTPNYNEGVHSSINRNKYVNVLPNDETYANVNTNPDYNEPAYCELNM